MSRFIWIIATISVALCAGLIALAPGVTALHAEVFVYAANTYNNGDPTGDIRLLDTGRAQSFTLISSDDFIDYPSWSPDGRQIAYIEDAIEIVRHDGRRLRTLGADLGVTSIGVWSPAENRIAALRWGQDRLYFTLLDMADKGEELPLDLDYVNVPFYWSPDGQRLLLTVRPVDGATYPAVYDVPTQTLAISPQAINLRDATWTPDSQQIIYTDGEQVVVTPVDWSSPASLPLDDIVYNAVTVAPDGTRLALIGSDRGFRIYLYDLTTQAIHQPNPGARASFNSPLVWTADGRQLAYTRNADIYLLDVTSGAVRQLTDTGDYNSGLMARPR